MSGTTKRKNLTNNCDDGPCKIASSKLAQGDIRGAIRILSSENYVLPYTKDNLELSKLKHHPMPTDFSPPEEPSDSERHFYPLITRQELLKSIKFL